MASKTKPASDVPVEPTATNGVAFKPTPAPDGPVAIGGWGDQLRIALSSTDPQPERAARMNALLDLDAAVSAALADGPAAEYRAAAAEAVELAAKLQAAREAVARLKDEHASATGNANPGLGERLVAIEQALTGAKREADLFGEQLLALHRRLREIRVEAELQTQNAVQHLRVDRKQEIDSELNETLDAIIKAVGKKLTRLLDLTAASNALASFDAQAATKGLAHRLLGPVPQPPARPTPAITGEVMQVRGLGRVGYTSASPAGREVAEQLNRAMAVAYRDRLEPEPAVQK